jgi:UDP-GlcNAc3NAcA epimerase
MYDASMYYAEKEDRSALLRRLGLTPKRYVLATIHRPSNTDDPEQLKILLDGLALVARELPVVWPVHPRTRCAIERSGLLGRTEGLKLIDAVGYLDMLCLERHARAIATDSGGVQKEAFFFRVPCVTMRPSTEWVELVESGWNRLLPPTNAAELAAGILAALDSRGAEGDPYGGGNACQRIVHALKGRSADGVAGGLR